MSSGFAEAPLDPISAFVRWVWEQVEASGLFADVRAGNRISFEHESGYTTGKEVLAAADLPQLVLNIPSLSDEGLNYSENMLTISCVFVVSLGSMQFYNKLPYLAWRVLRLIRKMQNISATANLGTDIVIETFEPGRCSIGWQNQEENKGVLGHAALITFSANVKYKEATYV